MLIDQFGVIHDGQKLYPGTLRVLSELKSARHPRRRHDQFGKARRGQPPAPREDGRAARSLRRCRQLRRGRLRKPHRRRAFLIGKDGEDYGFDGITFVSDPQDAEIILILGSNAPKTSLEDYRKLLTGLDAPRRLLQPGQADADAATASCPPPAPSQHSMRRWAARSPGSASPIAQIYREAARLIGNPQRILCIGDSAEHDVAGGRNAGFRPFSCCRASRKAMTPQRSLPEPDYVMDCLPMVELDKLRTLSARVGADPLLVQAAGGNTSLKHDGVMWIKASGTWLKDAAARDIFVPLDHARHPGRPGERTIRRVNPAPPSCAPTSTARACAPRSRRRSTPSCRSAWWSTSIASTPSPGPSAPMPSSASRKSSTASTGPSSPMPAPACRSPAPYPPACARASTCWCSATTASPSPRRRWRQAEALLATRRHRRHPPRARRRCPVDRAALAKLCAGTPTSPPVMDETHALATDPLALKRGKHAVFYPDHVVFLGVGVATQLRRQPAPRRHPRRGRPHPR